jgi:hypothetical protein
MTALDLPVSGGGTITHLELDVASVPEPDGSLEWLPPPDAPTFSTGGGPVNAMGSLTIAAGSASETVLLAEQTHGSWYSFFHFFAGTGTSGVFATQSQTRLALFEGGALAGYMDWGSTATFDATAGTLAAGFALVLQNNGPVSPGGQTVWFGSVGAAPVTTVPEPALLLPLGALAAACALRLSSRSPRPRA